MQGGGALCGYELWACPTSMLEATNGGKATSSKGPKKSMFTSPPNTKKDITARLDVFVKEFWEMQ
jgi:hypothetical protein